MRVESLHHDEHEGLIPLHGRSAVRNSTVGVTPSVYARTVGVSSSHLTDKTYTDLNSNSGMINHTLSGSKHTAFYSSDASPIQTTTKTMTTTTTTANGYTVGKTFEHPLLGNEKSHSDGTFGILGVGGNKTDMIGEATAAANAAAVAISIGSAAGGGVNNATSSSNSNNNNSGGGSISLLEFNARSASGRIKMFAALLYAVVSIGIMMLTKAIFTEFDFRCFIFIGFLQYITTTVVSLVRLQRGSISFPLRGAFRILFVDLFPLPMVFVFNTLSGLGATQSLNMPLFVLLRRLSIAMTLAGEAFFLRYRHDVSTRLSVLLMLAGAFVATGFDVQNVPMRGVFFVLVNDICTALNGVLTRSRLDEGRLSSEGVMFYTNAFAAIVAGLLLLLNVRGELDELLQDTVWSPSLLFFLTLNAMGGYAISYCTYLCMKLNSPLTVSMIGAGKNVVSSYVGMAFRDYAFAWPSFIGVNISVVGCVLYSYSEIHRMLRRQESETPPPPPAPAPITTITTTTAAAQSTSHWSKKEVVK